MQTIYMQIYTVMMASMGYLEILLAISICFLFLHRFSNNKGLPWNWPMVGMLPMLFFNFHRPHDKLAEVLERSKGTFLIKGAWFANMDILATCDPANVHYITSKNFSNYPKGSESKERFDVFEDTLFNADFDEWRNERKIIHSFFNHHRFHQFTVKILRDNLERGLIPVLEHVSQQDIVVDFQDLFQRLMFDATCILATGYDPCSLRIGFPEVPFSKAMNEACEAMFLRHIVPGSFWKLQRWLGIGKEKTMSNACKTLDHIVAKYLSMKREELSKGIKSKEDEEGFDLSKFYLTEDGIVGPTPTDKFIKETILGLIFAGRDTTSATLTWFFWLISKNSLVEIKIREELQANFPTKEGEIQWLFYREELSKLVYLHGALCETLRLFSSTPFQLRTPLQSDILPSGHRVNPKMKVVLSAYAMGRMASIWGKDCLEFKPERWISKKGGIKHEPSHKFFVFNAGPRTCPGKEFAFTQMKAIAATIIHNYHIQVVEGHTVTPTASIILHLKHGLMARVTKRGV